MDTTCPSIHFILRVVAETGISVEQHHVQHRFDMPLGKDGQKKSPIPAAVRKRVDSYIASVATLNVFVSTNS